MSKNSDKRLKKLDKVLHKEAKKLAKRAKKTLKGVKPENGLGLMDGDKLEIIDANLSAKEQAYADGTAEAGGNLHPDFDYQPEIVDFVFEKPVEVRKPKTKPVNIKRAADMSEWEDTH